MELKNGKWKEIFYAGKWTDMYGNTSTWTPEDIEQLADSYDPTIREATIGIGHQGFLESEQPRHGIITEVMASAGRLFVKPDKLSDELTAGVASGAWGDVSAEIMSPKTSGTGKAYLKGFAVLGRSQPALHSISKFAKEKDDLVYCFSSGISENENQKTKPIPKGETDMEEKDVRLAIAEAIQPFSARIEVLEKRPDITAEEFATVKAKAEKVADIETRLASVQAENSNLQKNAAEAEVTALLSGIPKAFASDETRALLLNLAQTDRKAFAAASAPFTPMKGKFAYLTREIVTEEGGTRPAPVESQAGYIKGKSEIDNKISVRTDELIAAAKKDGKELSFSDAGTQAWREVMAEEGE